MQYDVDDVGEKATSGKEERKIVGSRCVSFRRCISNRAARSEEEEEG